MQVMAPESHYDVVVVGGGMVGNSFVCLLRELLGSSLRVLVVEAVAHARDAGGQLQPSADFDMRTTALSWRSRQIYERAGIWPALAPHGCAIDVIHVSDRGRLGAVELSATEAGVEALGYVMANHALGTTLLRQVQQADDVHLLCPGRITAIQPRRTGMQLRLQHGEQLAEASLHATLVVLAEGARSGLCETLGIGIERRDYKQHALIANIAFEHPHRGVAHERFTAQGPMAVLPLPTLAGQHRGSLIWTLPAAEVEAVRALDDRAFLQRLQHCFGRRLGRIQRVGVRVLYPLSLSLSTEQVRPGLVLLGNAAHTLHPVAGQGMNLSLRDALGLAEHLAAALAADRSVGEMSVLQAYQQSRQKDQDLTVGFSHHLIGLFGSEQTVPVWTRKLGLAAIDLLPPARRWFARQAMGMAPQPGRIDLPR
jgi:2-octaprenyl-6-methoxyphenol hydroxylase